jgi:exonuclease SbcD
MKFAHISDLHIGKRVSEFSLLEDQEYILIKILNALDEIKPDSVLIAGDIYDKAVPSAEAVELFDDFLYGLAKRGLKVFIISGNHDSPERIAFGSRIMSGHDIYLSPVYDGTIAPITLEDNWGFVDVYSLPFIKPIHVRRYYPDEDINSYNDALRVVIENMQINPERRNILITHQFITGASRSESEDISVGGADNVDAALFDPFDYVALGHLHGPQHVIRESIRYCGTPLKYSFSEAAHTKSITVVELEAKGVANIFTVPLEPKRDMREIRGSYMEVTAKSFYEGTPTDDYLHITLTDEEDIPDVIQKLRTIYPNIMKVDYDNKRTNANDEILPDEGIERKSPLELFSDFYELQNGQELSPEQNAFMAQLVEQTWEGAK